MKKCYKAPEMVVVDLDVEFLMQMPSSINDGPDKDAAEAAQYRESYRSSLWND